MSGDFLKISRVGSLAGGTKWYLNDDCLLAAKRTLYSVEYRRFYLRDLGLIVVWRSRWWRLRLAIPAVLLAIVSGLLWLWVNSTAGEIFGSMALAWIAFELALGPTAESRIQTTGATIELALVKRTRRAQKVLDEIDAAVAASRDRAIKPAIPAPSQQSDVISAQTTREGAPTVHTMADSGQTNAF